VLNLLLFAGGTSGLFVAEVLMMAVEVVYWSLGYFVGPEINVIAPSMPEFALPLE